jgi:hypothetical protein
MEPENMSLYITFDGAELDAGHDAYAKLLGHRCRFGDSGDRIVIGQRDGGEADALRFPDDVGRRARSVGCRRVRVQVDERRRAVAV